MQAAILTNAMQRSDAVQVSGYPEDAPVSPDGTPPSSGLAEEAYQRYAPLTYSGSARRPWLGADTLQEATSSPPEAIPDKLVNGYVASGRDQVTDILSLMEATWCGLALPGNNAHAFLTHYIEQYGRRRCPLPPNDDASVKELWVCPGHVGTLPCRRQFSMQSLNMVPHLAVSVATCARAIGCSMQG